MRGLILSSAFADAAGTYASSSLPVPEVPSSLRSLVTLFATPVAVRVAALTRFATDGDVHGARQGCRRPPCAHACLPACLAAQLLYKRPGRGAENWGFVQTLDCRTDFERVVEGFLCVNQVSESCGIVVGFSRLEQGCRSASAENTVPITKAEAPIAKFLPPRLSVGHTETDSKAACLKSSGAGAVFWSSGNSAFAGKQLSRRRNSRVRRRKGCHSKMRPGRLLEQYDGAQRCSKDDSTGMTATDEDTEQPSSQPGTMSRDYSSGADRSSFMARLKGNPLLGFFEGASSAFSRNNGPLENDNIDKQLGRLVLPALLAQAAEPVAQLLETANAFSADELGTEIAIIALPALLALAADPLASLVDTGFIGQIGPVELAAVGVAISIFNLVSKMFNLPLLNITTSFVAEDEAYMKDGVKEQAVLEPILDGKRSFEDDTKEELLPSVDSYAPKPTKPMLPSVSSALVIATVIGAAEAAVLILGAGPILTIMGVGSISPMRLPAVQYLAVRALGAPAVVVALAVQGVFRGFKDTKTPLYATVLGNVVNIVLDPVLMFSLKLGVSGAAIATVLSQYLIAVVLLWVLNKRVTLLPPGLGDLRFDRFLKSGGLLLWRTLAILLTMTLATSMAARQGPVPMAAHQICMQVWLAASLLSDSLALAGQAIIASAFAKRDYRQVKAATFRILQMGLGLGLVMALVLGLSSDWFTKLFTKDVGVLEAMALIIPFVVATQPINALAFVFDGIHYGVSDFGYAAASMMTVAVPSCVVLLLAPQTFALPGVWIGLTVVMSLRMFAGFLRIGTCTGPWRFFIQEPDGRLQGEADLEENPIS